MKEKGKEKCFGKTNKQRSMGMNSAKHGVQLIGMDLVCIWGDICKTCMAFVYVCLGQKREEKSESEFKCVLLEEQEGE